MKSDAVLDKVRQALLPLVISVVMRDEWHVILTQRPETMPSHPGQIAFPGGKAEAGETIAQTALRETEEEIGIQAKDIELLGRLPSFNAVRFK